MASPLVNCIIPVNNSETHLAVMTEAQGHSDPDDPGRGPNHPGPR